MAALPDSSSGLSLTLHLDRRRTISVCAQRACFVGQEQRLRARRMEAAQAPAVLVVAEAADGYAALVAARQLRPALILVELLGELALPSPLG